MPSTNPIFAKPECPLESVNAFPSEADSEAEIPFRISELVLAKPLSRNLLERKCNYSSSANPESLDLIENAHAYFAPIALKNADSNLAGMCLKISWMGSKSSSPDN